MVEIIRPFIHYGLHFIFPIAIAYVFFKDKWKKAYLMMLATMLIDLDHLLATPLFDPMRCSVGFHPLHSSWAIGFYAILFFVKKYRIIAIGLLFHILTDVIDCFLMLHQ